MAYCSAQRKTSQGRLNAKRQWLRERSSITWDLASNITLEQLYMAEADFELWYAQIEHSYSVLDNSASITKIAHLK